MMLKIRFAFFNILLFSLFPLFGQSPNWHIVYRENSYFRFSNVEFINDQNGWIGGRVYESTLLEGINSLILKTNDGGNSWNEQKFDSLTNSAITIHSIAFLDSLTGVLTSYRKVYFTFDGGDNWTKFNFPNDSLGYYTAKLLNDSTWIIGGGETWASIPPGGNGYSVNVIKKTIDYGATWQDVFVDSLAPIFSIDFINDSCGVAISGNRILFTNNYGDNWNYLNHNPNLLHFNSIQFVDNVLFALATESNNQKDVLLISQDNGYSWSTRKIFDNQPAIFCMYFADSLFGKVGGITNGDNILLTTDGGFNWTEEPYPPNSGSILSIFTTYNTGYAGTIFDGTILKYGIPSHIQSQNNQSDSYQSLEIFPNPGNDQFNISISSELLSNIDGSIYNILGKKIKQLIKNKNIIGRYSTTWNSKNDMNQQVASGIYFVIIKTDKKILKKKILLFR